MPVGTPLAPEAVSFVEPPLYFDAEFPEARSRPVTIHATLKGIPSGEPGMIETLKIMRGMARESIRHPEQIVRKKALELVAHLAPREWYGQIGTLQRFVQRKIRYVHDPVGLEAVATPEKTLELAQGDCDDQATLLASLLESIGHPARFMAIGMKGKPFSHVLVQTKVNRTGNDARDWRAVETIIERPVGWLPPGITSRYILKV